MYYFRSVVFIRMSKLDLQTDRSKERLIYTLLIPVVVFFLFGGIYMTRDIEPHLYQAIYIVSPPIVWALYGLCTYRGVVERVVAWLASVIAVGILCYNLSYLLTICGTQLDLEIESFISNILT